MFNERSMKKSTARRTVWRYQMAGTSNMPWKKIWPEILEKNPNPPWVYLPHNFACTIGCQSTRSTYTILVQETCSHSSRLHQPSRVSGGPQRLHRVTSFRWWFRVRGCEWFLRHPEHHMPGDSWIGLVFVSAWMKRMYTLSVEEWSTEADCCCAEAESFQDVWMWTSVCYRERCKKE